MNDKLLDLLTCELGEVRSWKEECPGVYYLNVLPANGTCGEYYVILEIAPISQDVRAMGKQLYNTPALVYPMESDDGARWAVEYEMWFLAHSRRFLRRDRHKMPGKEAVQQLLILRQKPNSGQLAVSWPGNEN